MESYSVGSVVLVGGKEVGGKQFYQNVSTRGANRVHLVPFYIGVVWPGDTILATRERPGNWMKLVDLDGRGACWVFRGDEDYLFEFVEACDADQTAEFEGDYWTISTKATRDMGINVRKTPCMSGSILGAVWSGDVVLATRERSGSCMKLICWEEQRTRWAFRGNEDDLFQFDAKCCEQGIHYIIT